MDQQDVAEIKKQISAIMGSRKYRDLKPIAHRLGVPFGDEVSGIWVDAKNALLVIHTILQTETMVNTCRSAEESGRTAKQSCRWAAIAAVASVVSSVAGLATVAISIFAR